MINLHSRGRTSIYNQTYRPKFYGSSVLARGKAHYIVVLLYIERPIHRLVTIYIIFYFLLLGMLC